MADIKLTDAAQYYEQLPHQIEAWDWLQNQLSDSVLDTFASKYRQQIKPSQTCAKSWDGVTAAAKTAGSKWPEVVAAQWALESGWGQHVSGKNNYFGLKGNGSTVNTREFINGQWVTIKAGFIDFPDLYTCVCYLVDRWYKDFSTYKGVNRATSRNECAQLLVKEGYATDPNYAVKLIQIMDNKLGTPGENNNVVVNQKILTVPYEYQLNNQSGTGYRECFSSTCAMIAEYYGKVKSDDEYNKIRAKYGDTTNKDAQLAALRSLGLNARFITNGNAALLENEIRNDRPVAVGWLHNGPITRPTGGGHWTCCIGFTSTHFVFNDPNGQADMVSGGYVNHDQSQGKAVKYTRKNWLRRWECDGPNTGWAILVTT
jgi:hypothetical protein